MSWEKLDELRQKRIQDLIDLHRAYHMVFASPGADLVLKDLALRGFKNRVLYDPDSANAVNDALFREGRRSLLMHVEYMIDPMNFTEEALTRRNGLIDEGGLHER